MKLKLTAHEINEEYGVENENADITIDGIIQNTIVYTLDDVNYILSQIKVL